MKITVKKIALLAVAVLAIVLSVVCFCMDTGLYGSRESYGGDAYTGIQNAARETAWNVKDMAKIVQFGFGSVLLVAGLTIGIVAVCPETSLELKKKAPATPYSPFNPVPPYGAPAPRPNVPMPNAPMPNAPMPNAPVPNAPVPNAPMPNTPVPNAPVQNAPMPNEPIQNAPVQNAPVQNEPVQNVPAQNAPIQNAPMQDDIPPYPHQP